MTLSRIIYRLRSLNPGIELLALLSWLLFYPKSGGKETSYLFFLGLAVLVVLFSLRQVLSLKNIGLSPFSHSLTLFNLILILSIFFSIYYFRSIYFYADVFLISFYAILFFFDRSSKDKYLLYLSYMISIFSLINIIHHFLPLNDKTALFFTNTIRQGIISGIAVLILLYYFLRILHPGPSEGADAVRFLQKLRGRSLNKQAHGSSGLKVHSPGPSEGAGSVRPARGGNQAAVEIKRRCIIRFLILLAVNSAGVYVSRSKAAFIGIVVFGLLLIILKKQKLVLIPIILAILTFIIPNPVRDTFYFSLKKDPYAFDRVQIWQVPIAIFKDNPAGVGLDNFAEVSPKYNFKQTKGPANYFKVPRQPHNDYLKILAETGVLGLITLLVLLFFIFKKLFSSSLFDITKILILYLMFQAFLFNIIFHAFFFFLFVFLLKDLFEQRMTFKSFSFKAKLVTTFSLIFVLIICYFFPFLANRAVKKSQALKDPLEAAALLEKAAYFNPLNAEIYQR